jgi:DNA-binding PadR family transcriptional regulator
MDFLQSEILKLLTENRQMSAGTIMNKLNGFPLGMDVSLNVVERALHDLEAEYLVECQWRLKETPIQSDPPGGYPRSEDPRSN